MQEEFTRQVQNLIEKGYPQIYGKTVDEFRDLLEPLRAHIPGTGEADFELGTLPFVIVIKSINGHAEQLMELVEFHGEKGFSKLYPHDAKEFTPIESVDIPHALAYLLIDIDRGKDTLNVAPADAMHTIQKHNRSPLTIDEGIALITQFPEFLIKNNCYSLLASRCAGNKRVPAIWINASKRPNLGWCWDGNPHTWLGSASCAERIGAN